LFFHNLQNKGVAERLSALAKTDEVVRFRGLKEHSSQRKRASKSVARIHKKYQGNQSAESISNSTLPKTNGD